MITSRKFGRKVPQRLNFLRLAGDPDAVRVEEGIFANVEGAFRVFVRKDHPAA